MDFTENSLSITSNGLFTIKIIKITELWKFPLLANGKNNMTKGTWIRYKQICNQFRGHFLLVCKVLRYPNGKVINSGTKGQSYGHSETMTFKIEWIFTFSVWWYSTNNNNFLFFIVSKGLTSKWGLKSPKLWDEHDKNFNYNWYYISTLWHNYFSISIHKKSSFLGVMSWDILEWLLDSAHHYF